MVAFASTKGTDAMTTNASTKTAITGISKRHLSIETLKRRMSDRLDFHDVSVWGVEAALTAAYEAGRDAERTRRTANECVHYGGPGE